jgi:ABC-type Zn uptake system ZnuABC Zn-binding protein ZnuA
MRKVTLFLAGLTMWAITGCAAPVAAPDDSASTSETAARLRIVTTVSPITNVVYNIAGEHAEIVGIVPEGVNSHTYEPAPSDARQLADADLIFINGLKLEEPTLKLAEANAKEGAEIVLLGDQTITPEEYVFDFSFPAEGGSPNPHLWPNPFLTLKYAEIIRDTLIARDPAHADAYTPITRPLPGASRRWTLRSRRRSPASRNRTASCSPITIPGPTLRPSMA